ncbi:hypothetical protein O0I10_005999 [Lichtheimia ornata]|uniref:Uncharacterized protein n=1 Tax=Lichtheimia ornata TaxID=688661 RepID=A0AAD7V643_9FUNG|nr:uncharacterized protein O0I10_005999 [Lichtheimia ornata]KAJ8658316.1 hypothetical protein O0I10_005999 [Lichtheimia ornata]
MLALYIFSYDSLYHKGQAIKGIQTALSDYGNVLDYGILRDHDSVPQGKAAPLEITLTRYNDMPLQLHGPTQMICFMLRGQKCRSIAFIATKLVTLHLHVLIKYLFLFVGHSHDHTLPRSPSSQFNSHSSDISMLKLDLSPIESHNDNIINEYTPDDFDKNMPLPTPQSTSSLLSHIHHTYPMSDQAKHITDTFSLLNFLVESSAKSVNLLSPLPHPLIFGKSLATE